jgi:hypothetical protein
MANIAKWVLRAKRVAMAARATSSGEAAKFVPVIANVHGGSSRHVQKVGKKN